MIQQLKGGRFQRTLTDFKGLSDFASNQDRPLGTLQYMQNAEANSDGTLAPIGYFWPYNSGTARVTTTRPYRGYGLHVFNLGYEIPNQIATTLVADDGSGNCRVTTSSVHGIAAAGGYVFLTGFTTNTAYNGMKKVLSIVSTTRIDVDETYISDDHSGYVICACELTPASNVPMAVVFGDGGSISFTTPGMTTGTSAMFDLGNGHYPSFFDYMGIIRMSEGDPNGIAQPPTATKWLGYIKRTHFDGLTNNEENHNTMYYDSSEPAAPTAGIAGEHIVGSATNDGNSTNTNLRNDAGAVFGPYEVELDKGTYYAISTTDSKAVLITTMVDNDDLTTEALSGTWQNDTFAIYPPAGAGFNLSTASAAYATSTWADEEIKFASSFIYDGNQESLLYEMPGTFTVPTGDALLTVVRLTGPFNPRITGGRIYCRTSGSNTSWKLLLDIDLDKGVKTYKGESYSGWNEQTATHPAGSSAPDNKYIKQGTSISTAFNVFADPPNITYESLNGFSHTEDSLACPSHQCACAVMNRVFVSNYVVENAAGAHDHVFGSIRYSELGKADTFPTSRELVLGDCMSGKTILNIIPFRNRIVALATDAVAIINVESPNPADWFVQYVPMPGIVRKFGATLTDFGVAWISGSSDSKKSVYLYDGERIRDLLLEESDDGATRSKLSTTYTNSFDTDTSIGYDGLSKKIIILYDAGSATAGSGITISLLNNRIGTFTRLVDSTSMYSTNFAQMYGRAVLMVEFGSSGTGTMHLYTWVDTPPVFDTVPEYGEQNIRTNFDDFEAPGSVKKIYAVTIMYKLAKAISHTFFLGYAKDGTESWGSTYVPSGTLALASGWTLKRFEFTTPIQCDSLSLRFKNNSEEDNFWIDKIIIEGRVIHKKNG